MCRHGLSTASGKTIHSSCENLTKAPSALLEKTAAQNLAFDCQPVSLVIVEADTFFLDVLFLDLVFSLHVFNPFAPRAQKD